MWLGKMRPRINFPVIN